MSDNGERGLLWELFLMIREMEPPTAEHTKRQQEWAAKFHAELEGSEDRHQAVDTADHDEDEPAEDPHEHGSPARPKIGRKKK